MVVGKRGRKARAGGIWYVPTVAKDQYAYKLISHQMKGAKFSWRGMPKSAYAGRCLVLDLERSQSATVVIKQGNIMIQI